MKDLQSQKEIRVRFAPSPTGPLHIGGVRTALYNYLFAKKHNGKFILRIEDTDQTRFIPGAEEYILEALEWCGLQIDEGPLKKGPAAPYRQSERLPLYRNYAHQMLEKGTAYMAFDTPEELEMMRFNFKTKENPSPQYDANVRMRMKNSLSLNPQEVEKLLKAGKPYVIRFLIPDNEEIIFQDRIRGEVRFNSAQLDDKVLFKSDGFPTYHLANVVDDHMMGITHVIRGEEWLPSAPLHVLLYKALGWANEMPEFAHLPLILKPSGSGKLSKRDGDKHGFPVFPLQWNDPETKAISAGFRETGFLPEAFVNMLAFLGWNPGTEQELFSLKELEKCFSLGRVNKAGARFDFEKAKWYNQQYILAMPDKEIADHLAELPALQPLDLSATYLTGVAGLMKERVTFIADIPVEGSYLFGDVKLYDEAMISKKWNQAVQAYFLDLKQQLKPDDTIEEKAKILMQEHNLGMGQVMPMFRIILCGVMKGPAVFEVADLIGTKEVCSRIDRFMNKYPIEKSIN